MFQPLLRVDFDDDAGATCLNSGTEADGVYSSTPWARADTSLEEYCRAGQGIDPSTVAGGILFPSSLYDTVSLSYGAWIKCNMSKNGATHALISNFDYNDQTEGFAINFISGQIYISYVDSGGTYTSQGMVLLADGEIGHLALTIGANVIIFYKNGEIADTRPINTLKPGNLNELCMSGKWSSSAGNYIFRRMYYIDFIDNVFFHNAVATQAEIKQAMCWGLVPAKPTPHLVTTNVEQEANIFPFRLHASTSISNMIQKPAPTGVRATASNSFVMEAVAKLNFTTTYRVTKGAELSDAEIDKNFINCFSWKTPTPVCSGGVVANHVVGTFYFGDVTVDDSTGNYTGTGSLFALRSGLTISNKVVVS